MARMKGSYKALLVVYHSINKYREDRIRVPNIVTPTTFEYQIQSLASTARILLSEVFNTGFISNNDESVDI